MTVIKQGLLLPRHPILANCFQLMTNALNSKYPPYTLLHTRRSWQVSHAQQLWTKGFGPHTMMLFILKGDVGFK